MSEKISDELNYSQVVSNHSTPVFRNVAPQNSASITLSTTSGGSISEFIIPPSVFNFSKSRLNFDLSTAATASNFNYINANLLTSISRVVVYDSATNAQLLDIGSFEKYASLVSTAGTSLADFLTKSFVSVNPATTIAGGQPVEDIGKLVASAANPVQDGTNVDSTSGNVVAQGGQTQRRQFYIGGSGAATQLRVSIPLSAFKFTVLASDRLLYSPSNIVIQIYWNATNNFGFVATSATDILGTPAVLGTTTIANVSLSLCNEGNLQIVSSVIDKVMKEGLTMPIGYPSITRFSNSAAVTSVSTYIPLTKAYGNRILALVSGVFRNGSYSQINARGVFDTSSYNTFLNNVAILSQSGFTTGTSGRAEDYIIANKDFFKGSALQTVGEYRFAEWVHIDSFFGRKPLYELNQHEIDGLDVGNQTATYSQQFNYTTGVTGGANYVTAILGQKMLTLSAQGSMVM